MTALTIHFETALGHAMLEHASSEGHAPNLAWLGTPKPEVTLPDWVQDFLRLAARPEGVKNTAEVRRDLGVQRDAITYWAPKLVRLGWVETSTTHGLRLYRATEAGNRRIEQ